MRKSAGVPAERDRAAGGKLGRWLARAAAAALIVMLVAATPRPAAAEPFGATTVPQLWTAGGLSAGSDSAGQAARMATDASGNVAIVSGPAQARSLAVTSYTASGALRWQRMVSPGVGTFRGDWVVAAPNGDFAAVGTNVDSHGDSIGITMVRYASDGTLLWRLDLARWRPSVARLIADSAGNTYLAFSSIGDGQDMQVHKYNAAGVLLWSRLISTTFFASDIATSLALSPDGADVVVTGDISGGAEWITAVYDAATGARRWLVTAPEGIAALDVVVDATRVYVTGQGSVGINGFLTVIAYDRSTGARLWRRDANPPACCAWGRRIALAPDGSLVVAGSASSGGYMDWWLVAMDTSGAVKWQARRDRAVTGDEIPTSIFVLADGTTVVSGIGGPVTRDILGNSYMQGVTAGYSQNGTPLWEGFSKLGTTWATALPNGDVCATGGYDALITCFRVTGVVRAVMSATPPTGTAPLSVTFDGSGSTTPNGAVTSWAWSFGDGALGTGPLITHLYAAPGTYPVSLTVTDSSGASSTATGSIVAKPLPPAAPSNLTASQSGYSIRIFWLDNSSNESIFYIERCEGRGCTNFAAFAFQSANIQDYTDMAVVAGTSYSYRVRAYNSGGYSAYTNVASMVAGVPNQAPAAVMSLAPSSGAAPLNVAFDGSRSTDPDGTVTSWAWSFGDGASATGSRTTHLYTAPGTYMATLTVTDNGGASSSTTTDVYVSAAPLPAPANLTATALTRSSIGLKWTNPTAGQLRVTIERCTGSGCTNFVEVATVAGTATAFTDSGLAARTTYTYRVRADTALGLSPYSNTASARTKR